MKHHVINALSLPTSQRSEFERHAPEQRTRRGQRPLGHLARSGLVLSDNPRWIAGQDQADAKFEVATTIRTKHPDGVHLYHRRVVNGHLESSIDILAVTTSGVWVITVEEARRRRVEFKERSAVLRARYERFLVDGEDYTSVLDDIGRKGDLVAAGVAEAGRAHVPVTQVLCLLGAKVPGGPTLVGSCYLTTLPQLVRLMKGGSELAISDIAQVGLALGERFRRPRRHA